MLDLHLRLLWTHLQSDWPRQLARATKNNVNALDLRDNAVEDLLTLVHDQVEFLLHIAPLVRTASHFRDGSATTQNCYLGERNVYHLLQSLVEAAATIYAWSEYYVCTCRVIPHYSSDCC